MVTRLPITSKGSIQNPTADGDADYSCLGMRMAPTSTATDLVTFELKIEDFEDDFTTEGLRVQVFANNIVDLDSCDAPECSEGTTNSNGVVQVMGRPGAWFAYRVFEMIPPGSPREVDIVRGSVQYNNITPAAGGMTDGVSISQKSLNLIPTVLGFNRKEGTAMLAGAIEDCAGDNVYGTRARVLVDGAVVPEGMNQFDPHYRYFNGDSFPSATQTFSHVDGLYSVANLEYPAGTNITMEIEGRRVDSGDGSPDADPVVLSRERVAIFPDTITIVNPTPLRAGE